MICRSVFVAMVSVSVVPPSGETQTTMFRGGGANTGVYPSTAPTLTTTVWKFRTNGRVISSPAWTRDVVYVQNRTGPGTPTPPDV